MEVPGWTAEKALTKPSKAYWSGTAEATWVNGNYGLAPGIVAAQAEVGYGEGYEMEDYGEEYYEDHEEEHDESESEESQAEEGEVTET